MVGELVSKNAFFFGWLHFHLPQHNWGKMGYVVHFEEHIRCQIVFHRTYFFPLGGSRIGQNI